MPPFNRREEKLRQRLQHILQETDLTQLRELVDRLCEVLEITPEDCAAALIATHPAFNHPQTAAKNTASALPTQTGVPLVVAPPSLRPVCYRLDVGSQHQVMVEDIKALLVEESGVEKSRISRVDIYPHYTLVELPEGMPADVFRLLTEAKLANRKLNIKRVKAPSQSQRRHFRPHRKPNKLS